MNTIQKKQTILIVDDDEDNLDILSNSLTKLYNIATALNGAQALKIVAKSKPDLILLDILMPEMDGYEVIRRLKQSADSKDIPVIFITSKSELVDEEFGLSLGACDYITKPINPSIVLARVKTHLILYAQQMKLEQQNAEQQKVISLLVSNEVLLSSPVVLFRWKAAEGWPVEFVSSNVSQFGYTANNLLSGEILYSSIIHPDDLERVALEVKENSAAGVERFEQEYRIVSPEGDIYWIDDRTTIERDAVGNIFHYQGIILNITERKQVENDLQKSNDKFRALVETTHDFVWEVTADGVYTYCSPQTFDILGYQAEELLGKKPFDLMSEKEAERVEEIFNNAVAQQTPIEKLENTNLSKEGQEVVLETNGKPFFNLSGVLQGFRGIDRDITRRKQAEVKLQHMANHDPLTRLPNRRKLITDFQHESKRASRFDRKLAFFYLDLNRFKKVNDDLGHEVGDVVLQYITEKISCLLRETENIYRVGGDEFCILIPEFNNKEQLEVLAERIVEGISSIDHFGGMVIDIGCSIGIAISPDNGKTLADLTSAADNAMYYAKITNGNDFYFVNTTSSASKNKSR